MVVQRHEAQGHLAAPDTYVVAKRDWKVFPFGMD